MRHIKNKNGFPWVIASLLLLLSGCDPNEQDYKYVITNKTTMEEPILVTYNIEGKTNAQSDTLSVGDSIVIAQRKDIEGKSVWNIESSVSLYKVPHLRATNADESKVSEELAYRKFWDGPSDINGDGIYQLNIEDKHFQLSLQNEYTYCIKNQLDDTIFTTSYLKLTSGENMTRSADTILAGESQSIGSVNIYTYNDSIRNEGKYKIQKISGLSSIFFLYKGVRIEMKMDKDTAFFQTGKDTCTLIISNDMPKIQNIKW